MEEHGGKTIRTVLDEKITPVRRRHTDTRDGEYRLDTHTDPKGTVRTQPYNVLISWKKRLAF